MNKALFYSAFFLLSCCACAAIPKPRSIDAAADSACLTACKTVPAAIAAYEESHNLITERDDIDYLLWRIKTSPSTFFRNGATYDGSEAARFLRWKTGWWYHQYHELIRTGDDLVEKVLSGSQKTGKPYYIIQPDGTWHNARAVMRNELKILHEYRLTKEPGSSGL